MQIRSTKALGRPNIWAAFDVCEATVVVEAADLLQPREALRDRLLALLPEFGGFDQAETGSQSAGEGLVLLLCRLALTLQSIGRGSVARFHRVVPTREPGVFRAVFEAIDLLFTPSCLDEAASVIHALRDGRMPDIPAIRSRLMEHADDICLGPSTMLIVQAAEDRGIPWQRLSHMSLVQLGQGRFQRRIWTAETDRTSAIAESISRDKQLTKRLVAAAGVPVPRGRLATTPTEAWEAATAVGLPVVVKPLDGNRGRGVSLNLSTREEVEHAFGIALEEIRSNPTVIVEELIPGVEHRLLVIGSRMVACARGENLFVTGDGRRTVAQLIEQDLNSDPRRGRSEAFPNKTIDIDATVRVQLAQEGVTPETILPPGRRVLVKRIGSHGRDVTDEVHPDIAAAAVRAARAVGLDVAGIDLVAEDISKPMREQGARVCEVNAGPQLLIHAYPEAGTGRPVGHEILATLFGDGETGRIPIIAMLGIADPNTPLELQRLLRSAGRSPGLACSLGIWLAGDHCGSEDSSSVDAARDLLVAPDIDAAIFGLDWRSLADRGSPAGRIDVLVLGPFRDAEDSEECDAPAVIRAIATALPADGTIVLAGAAAWVARLAAETGRRVVESSDPAADVARLVAAAGRP
ncbi:MAG: acetate--CoA ligase family protein [Planctomycetia bacterium]